MMDNEIEKLTTCFASLRMDLELKKIRKQQKRVEEQGTRLSAASATADRSSKMLMEDSESSSSSYQVRSLGLKLYETTIDQHRKAIRVQKKVLDVLSSSSSSFSMDNVESYRICLAEYRNWKNHYRVCSELCKTWRSLFNQAMKEDRMGMEPYNVCMIQLLIDFELCHSAINRCRIGIERYISRVRTMLRRRVTSRH